MSDYKDFLDFNCSYEESRFVVIPAPLELTVSYGKGTSKGPEAILDCIMQLETYDLEFQKDAICYKVHTTKPLTLDKNNDPAMYMEELSIIVTACIRDGKIPIVLGGEHSLSYGVFKGIIPCNKEFSILHFDSHLDLRDSYENSKYSHASVLRRMWDHPDSFKNAVSVGIRSVSMEEATYLKTNKKHSVFYAHDFYKSDISSAINSMLAENIYITFDVDALDPAIMPATGTPEPGGLGWYGTLNILRKAIQGRKVIGLDIVELAPDGVTHYSQFTATKLLYKMMAYISQEGL